MSSTLESVFAFLDAGETESALRLLQERGEEVFRDSVDGPALIARLVKDGYRELLPAVLALDAEPARAWIRSASIEELSAFYDGESPLNHLIAAGDTELVRRLLARGVSPDAGMVDMPIMQAAFAGRADLVSLLLEFGAEPNQLDRHNATAILTAACAGHREVVETLLAYGADPNVIETCGYSSALSLAAQQGHKEIYDLLYPVSSEESRSLAAQKTIE